MRYKYNIYIKNEDSWPRINRDLCQIGNYAEWGELTDLEGNEIEDPMIEDKINKELVKFNKLLKDNYFKAGDIIDKIIDIIDPSASALGKKSAEVRKKNGHDSKYYSELAKKRWNKKT